MSAISPTGELYFTVFEGSLTSQVFLGFLECLVGHFGTKVHLVVSQHSVHRSKAVRTWVAEHAEQIELHSLPSYSPHLNLGELGNADGKRCLVDEVITDRQRMRPRSARSSRAPAARRYVGSSFQGLHTSYTTRNI